MARPQKCRRICKVPETDIFGPIHKNCKKNDIIEMTLDEYESIRLIDLENYTQEQCAKQMDIARTTVQWIYNAARKKLADALVNGKSLKIQGGNYIVCQTSNNCCKKQCCCQKRDDVK